MSDSVNINFKAFLLCKKCHTGRLSVGLTDKDELAVVCDDCREMVLFVKEWPDPEVTKIKCAHCEVEAHKCNKHLN